MLCFFKILIFRVVRADLLLGELFHIQSLIQLKNTMILNNLLPCEFFLEYNLAFFRQEFTRSRIWQGTILPGPRFNWTFWFYLLTNAWHLYVALTVAYISTTKLVWRLVNWILNKCEVFLQRWLLASSLLECVKDVDVILSNCRTHLFWHLDISVHDADVLSVDTVLRVLLVN